MVSFRLAGAGGLRADGYAAIPPAEAGIDLYAPFRRAPGERPQLVGIEIECGLVDPRSGRAVSYYGPSGLHALLEAVLAYCRGRPVYDGESLVGISLDDGARISLEPGGAIEYASAPSASIENLAAKARSCLETIASLADEKGIAVLAAGMLPFNEMNSIPWIPQKRIDVMRRYFRRLGDHGALADGVMGLTLSTQVHLDYDSESDLSEKLCMLAAATPVIAALFVNSPLEAGKVTGAMSRRMQLWRKIDHRRCGVMPFVDGKATRVRDIVNWVASQPMIYRSVDGVHVAAPREPFRDVLTYGFDDGSPATQYDWECQLSQVWPDVRVRRTIELRVADGAPWHAFPAVPAIWAGLTYHPASLRAAWQLVQDRSVAEIDAATDDVAVRGLSARYGPDSVADLAREFLKLAREGLEARVNTGLESATVVGSLDPLDEIIDTGVAFAEEAMRRWLREFGERPESYIAAYRVC
jgi:glutamate--cysteine ligase